MQRVFMQRVFMQRVFMQRIAVAMIVVVGAHRSVWNSRCNSRARGSMEEIYICS